MWRQGLKTWFFLCRPWSVTATIVPALTALGMGWGASFDARRWTIALVAAIPLQIACNLLNTWGDDRSGVDAAPGAYVTTPQLRDGLVSSRQIFLAAVGCLAFTALLGFPLLFFRDGAGELRINLAICAIAAIGFLGSTNYATGIRFKYHGLGVPFVFFLMGPVEIAGFLAAARPGAMPQAGDVALLSFPVACLVAVILHGNDMRDIDSDTAAGIRTTASTLGPRWALVLYHALHLAPYAFCICTAAFARNCTLLLPFLALPLTSRTLLSASRTYRKDKTHPPWLGLERASGGIHAIFGILYATALLLAHRV